MKWPNVFFTVRLLVTDMLSKRNGFNILLPLLSLPLISSIRNQKLPVPTPKHLTTSQCTNCTWAKSSGILTVASPNHPILFCPSPFLTNNPEWRGQGADCKFKIGVCHEGYYNLTLFNGIIIKTLFMLTSDLQISPPSQSCFILWTKSLR